MAVALAPRSSAAAGTSLRRCLELAERNHPKLAEARAKVAQVRAQLQEAYYTPFSQFRLQGGFGLAPTLRGSAVFSPNTDASLTSSLGMAWQAGINGVVPLWTFGKLDNLWDAARHNVDLNEGQADMARDAVRFDVRQAYLGLQLARDGLHLLDNAQGQIDKAVDNLSRSMGSASSSSTCCLRLSTALSI
ncbi:MAG: TolC family protein [Myxococcota bacterium]